MKRRIIGIFLAVIFLGLAILQYKLNYDFRIQPPSAEWSKEVLVSSGQVNSIPKMVNYKGGYVIAHDDGNKVKIIMVDNLGKKIRENVFPAEDTSVRYLNLLTDGENLYLNWVVYSKGLDNIVSLKLDRNLNIVEKSQIHDIGESTQINDNIFIIGYNDKIEIIDYKNNQHIFKDALAPSKIAGTLTKDGYLITYYENRFYFKYFTVKDGKASQTRFMIQRPSSDTEAFFNVATAADSKYGYMIIERRNKTNYGQNLLITFPLAEGTADSGNGNSNSNDSGAASEKNLEISVNDQFIYSPASVSSGDSAKFMAGYARKYGRSTRQFNIMEFAIKDGKITSTDFVTRNRQAATSPWVSGDAVVYCSLIHDNMYNVYMESQNNAFKAANNGVRNSEIKQALLDVVVVLANSIFSVITIGARWFLPGFALISIISLLGYRLNLKRKKIFFMLAGILTSLFKLYSVYSFLYGTYLKQMPGILHSVAFGILASLAVSIFSYWFGYLGYKNKLDNNPDAMPILSFIISLAADSFLTLFIFVPFIM